MRFQIFFGTLIVLLIIRLFLKFRKGNLKLKRFLLYLLFWLIVLLAIVFPDETNKVAAFFNITRGADFVIYVSLLTIFYLLFRIFEKIERLEKNLTKVVRETALIKEVLQERDENK